MKKRCIYKIDFIIPTYLSTWYGIYEKRNNKKGYIFTYLYNTGTPWTSSSFTVYKSEYIRITKIGLPKNHPELLV